MGPPQLFEIQRLRDQISAVVKSPKTMLAADECEVRVPLKLYQWKALLWVLESVLTVAFSRRQNGAVN
jgi:hypothetical protein